MVSKTTCKDRHNNTFEKGDDGQDSGRREKDTKTEIRPVQGQAQ